MRLLVLTPEPITAEQLRAALPGDADPRSGEVMIIAPALQSSPIKFWLTDSDEAIARAQQVRRESEEQLTGEGVSVSSDIGESDPLLAIQDALQTFPADRIVVFSRGEDGGYREPEDAEEIRQRFGLPVDLASP